MAFSPELGAPSTPAVSYAPGGSTKARDAASRSQQSGGSTNRAGSTKRRQAKKQQTRVADKGTGTNLITNDVSFGLSRPYIPWNLYAFNLEANPAATPVFLTASGTFVTIVTACNEPQHPRVRVRVRVVMGATTAGEVRLMDRATGTVISSILTVTSGSTVEANLDGTLIAPTLSGVGAPMKVDVQGRVTAGANNLALLVLYAVGIGSA